MKWWINREGEPPKGPYNWQELATLSGFYEDTLVSREGDKNWVEAAEDPELEPLFESPMEGAKLRSQLRLRSADVQGSEEEFEESSALRSHPITPSDPKKSNGDSHDSRSEDSTADADEEPATPESESGDPKPSEPVATANGDGSHSPGESSGADGSTATEEPGSPEPTEEIPSEGGTADSGEEIIDYAALAESTGESETPTAEPASEDPGSGESDEHSSPDEPRPEPAPEETSADSQTTDDSGSSEEDSEPSAVVIPTESPETPSQTDEDSPEFDPSVTIPPRPTGHESRESVEPTEDVPEPDDGGAEPSAPKSGEPTDEPEAPEPERTEPREPTRTEGSPESPLADEGDDSEPTVGVPGPNGDSPTTLEPPVEEPGGGPSEEIQPQETDTDPEPERESTPDLDEDDDTSVPIPGTEPEPISRSDEPTRSEDRKRFAGMLPRTLAFLTDGVLLGLLGFVIGLGNFSFLAELGSAGRLIGFLGALWYFGVGNSWVTWGQTPGKYLFGIRVLGRDGNPISMPRSLLRFSVIGIPFFLFNLKLGGAAYTEFFFLPLRTVLTLSVFGLGGSLIYVLLINGRSRRSLHDYLADSVVVEKDATDTYDELPSQIPRGHRWVLGSWVSLLFLATIIMPFYWSQFPTIRSMNSVERAMLRSGTYHSVRVQPSPSEYLRLTRAGGPVSSVRVDLWFGSQPSDMKAELRRAGQRILRNLPTLPENGRIVLQGHYGFDLGVSRYFNSRSLIVSTSARQNPAASSNEAPTAPN